QRTAVMQRGEIVEIGSTEKLFTDPEHPYTRQLVSAIPSATPRRRRRGASAVPSGAVSVESRA
ncbi:oligopeptide/dipeptide ABC transporter ATP-binding protein, partial [Pseudonocardia pini]|uniref:oligopeptide/dipeptide ABC transporter ATP-binding protein n=1 Tax=Pseudonocardia pini TaxID=2758030 RepID=UPI0035E408CE